LRPDGRVLVELDPPGTPPATTVAHLDVGGALGPRFRWCRVAADTLDAVASASDMQVDERWHDGTRWFGRLRRQGTP
jgi:hypothetical protein